jgi:hypothetical protein
LKELDETYDSVEEMIWNLSKDKTLAEEFIKKKKEREVAYQDVLKMGCKTAVYDCRRALFYQHPWLVVFRPKNVVIGCWTRKEARLLLRELKKGNLCI